MNKKTKKYCLFLLIPALLVVFLYGGGKADEVMAKTFSTFLPTTTATMKPTTIPSGSVIPTAYTWNNVNGKLIEYADTRETPPAEGRFFASNNYRASEAPAGAPYTVSEEIKPASTDGAAGDIFITWTGSVFAPADIPTETLVTVQTMYPTDLETADPTSANKSAKTGDNNSFIWIALALIVLSGGVVCYVLRKKTNKENQ